MNVFNDYSRYYDLLYQDKDYEAETSYIIDLINKYHKNTRDILELGCGTGKHASILAQNNFKIHGIDLSRQMLEIANQKSNPNTSFAFGDVRSYRINKKFDCVISLFHVASYQNTNEDLDNFFSTANEHLKSNGIFIFDAWYGPAVLTQLPESRSKTLENNQLKITRNAFSEVDFNENIVKVNYEIDIFDKINNLHHKLTETHNMRYLFLNEVKMLAKKHHFDLIDYHQFLTQQHASKESWGVCFILKKI
ncbi:methyltransferase [Alphaproteobacteria bacterium]|nr:methyltransferase [Alphaproteobacteria bacterium]